MRMQAHNAQSWFGPALAWLTPALITLQIFIAFWAWLFPAAIPAPGLLLIGITVVLACVYSVQVLWVGCHHMKSRWPFYALGLVLLATIVSVLVNYTRVNTSIIGQAGEVTTVGLIVSFVVVIIAVHSQVTQYGSYFTRLLLGSLGLLVMVMLLSVLIRWPVTTQAVVSPLPLDEVVKMVVIHAQQSDSSVPVLVGAGPTSFQYTWVAYRGLRFNQYSEDWATEYQVGFSPLLTYMIETGIFGMLAWSLFLLSVFIGIYRNKKTLVGMAALVSILLLGMTIVGSISVILTAIAVGLLIPAHPSPTCARPLPIWIKTVLTIVVLVVAIWGLTFLTRAFIAEHHFTAALAMYQDEDIKSAQVLTEAALTWRSYPLYQRIRSQIYQEQLRSALEAENSSNGQVIENLASLAVSTAEHTTALASYDYRNWLVLGNAYRILTQMSVPGAAEQAVAAYHQARQLARGGNPAPDYLFAEIKTMIGDYETAAAELCEALYKRPDYAPALSLQQYLVDEIGVSAEQFLECAQN